MFRSAIDIAGIMLWIILEPYMGQEQVDEGQDEVALPELEGAGRELACPLGDLQDAQHGEQGGVLQDGDEVVSERRDDGPHRLG